MEFSGRPKLALTYKNDHNQDGAGAQLQRIYGIYGISRFLGIPYVHSPIGYLGYQGLSALQENTASADLLGQYNRVFQIPSDVNLPETRVTHDMIDADAGSIDAIRHAADSDKDFHLIRIVYPYPITDKDPELYRCVKPLSPFQRGRSNVFRLAVHVRRGELYAIDGHRMLPNSYYVSAVLKFREFLRKLDIPFVCELYTEVATRKFEVTPQHHGISERISENVTFDPEMNHLEDFDAIPDLERYINTDPIETLGRMATADALILSRSCFSYVPAILSANCIVVYYPICHSPMKDWLIALEDGSIPESRLIERIEAWKRAGESTGLPLAPATPRVVPERGRIAQRPVYEVVDEKRHEIFRVASEHGASHVRLVGAVGRGDGRFDSDIDLLMTWREGASPSGQAALGAELESLLERRVGIASHDGSRDGAAVAYYRDIVRPRILRTAPVDGTADPVCELNVLTCRNDWLDLVWSLKSFYRYSGRHYALAIHDDGTVPPHGIEHLRHLFPQARLISRSEADARVHAELRDYPRCLEFRRRHPVGQKPFDFAAFLESDRMLMYDSDLLFFKEPTALLERIEDPAYRKNVFNADCQNGYTVDPDTVCGQIGLELVPQINGGLGLIHKGSVRADWCEEFLGLPGFLGGPFWWNEEQTLVALCSSRFGAELLPEEYTLRLDPGIGGRPFRHYINRIRHPLMYSEGIRALVEQHFLPWHFVVLLESGRL